MKKQSSPGHVVLVSSTAGQRGEAFHCDYAATKGAVISMVKGLSTELARDGIRVNCVAPVWVMTDMSIPALSDAATREIVLNKIPLGRGELRRRLRLRFCFCVLSRLDLSPEKYLTLTAVRCWWDDASQAARRAYPRLTVQSTKPFLVVFLLAASLVGQTEAPTTSASGIPIDQANMQKARVLINQAIEALGGQAYLEISRT